MKLTPLQRYLAMAVALLLFVGCSEDETGPLDPGPPDPPAPVESLEASPDGHSVTLTWNHPVSHPPGYEIQYLDSEPLDEDDWQEAERIGPEQIDRWPRQHRIQDLEPNQVYYFSMFALDASGNRSERSATASTTTAPPLIRTIEGPLLPGYGMSVSPEGDVYLAAGFEMVWIPTELGEPVVVGLGDRRFEDIATAATGHVFMVSEHEAEVGKYTHEGVFLMSWGDHGTQRSEFDDPEAVGVALDGSVLVADTENARVQVFDQDGAFLTSWDVMDADGAEYEPFDIAINDAGQIYLLARSYFFDSVLVFTSEGEYLRSWGKTCAWGCADADLHFPQSIAVAQVGGRELVYITENEPGESSGAVKVFDSDGNLVTKWRTRVDEQDNSRDGPQSIAVNNDGELLVAGYRSGGVEVYRIEP